MINTWNERLKFALNEKKVKSSALAKAVGVSAASVSDWLSSVTKKMEAENGIKVCTYLDLSPAWLFLGKGEIWITANSPLVLNQDKALYGENILSLPLMNSAASMGSGEEQTDNEIVIDVLRISKDWLNKTLINISAVKNLAFIHGIGDSMSPTFNDGDILLVDTGISSVRVDGVYVLEAHERLFIKRVRQRIDSAYEISSDNPTVKTSDILNGDHQVSVKGRVVWVWNGRKI